MNPEIKVIEDLSLNAWPCHQIQLYDGWLLRFSYFYTHRTNCVEQIGASSIPIEEKILYCEDIYRKWGTPAIFKINPLLPADFEPRLIDRGYEVQHSTDVMVLNRLPHQADASTVYDRLQASGSPAGQDGDEQLVLRNYIAPEWIDTLFGFKKTTNAMHRRIVPGMYQAIPKDVICASVQEGGRIAAIGLGILDRDYIGVYAIHVHPDFRRRHLASRICSAILAEGQKQGAKRAYLQVVSDNEPAKCLYRSLGFQNLYMYWFRVKTLGVSI